LSARAISLFELPRAMCRDPISRAESGTRWCPCLGPGSVGEVAEVAELLQQLRGASGRQTPADEVLAA
jgi:hypothetical protein